MAAKAERVFLFSSESVNEGYSVQAFSYGLWLRAARSPADFFKVAMAPATAMKVHDFDYFQCVQVGRVSGWHARVEVEEEACNARTG